MPHAYPAYASRSLTPAPATGLAEISAPTAADLVSISSYALGLWWCFGGPNWAGIASIVADEVDGRLARLTGTTSEKGSALDWGIDMALTPLSLMRLGKTIKHPIAHLLAAPPLMYAQASYRAEGKRPAFGSVRAAVMVTSMVLEALKNSPHGAAGGAEEVTFDGR